MKKSEQKKFIKDLMKCVKDKILTAIEKKKVPKEWDGFELRQWLADEFTSEAGSGKKLIGKRKKEYKRVVATNNL